MRLLQACALLAGLAACAGGGEGRSDARSNEAVRTGSAPATAERGDAMDWYVSYTEDLADGQVLVLIHPAGESTVTTTGPLGALAEIGHYRTPLPGPRCEAVRSLLQSSGYAQAPPPAPQPPETGFLSVGEGVAGQAPTMRGFPLADLPAGLGPVRAEMARVIDEIRAHPHHVVGGEGTWAEATVAAGRPVGFALTLTNRGVAPAEILNPAWREAEPAALLILAVGRDLPPEQFSEERDLDQIQLAAADLSVRRPDGSDLAPASSLVLGPGESVVLAASRRMYLAPGRYRGAVTLRAAGGSIAEQALVKGALHVRLGTLTVEG